jgi:hypothetical protein
MAACRKPHPDEPTVGDTVLRKKRFERSADAKPVSLTPQKLTALSLLLDYRFLIVPHLMRLTGISDQTARRCFRDLCDAGLVEKIAVPRAALAEENDANDAGLAFGSAPTIHALTKAGAQVDAGMAERDALKRPPVDYGPKNSLFLRHEMFVRDIRVWLATLTGDGVGLRSWRDADDCVFPLPGGLKLRPDGGFILDVGERDGRKALLAGFIEADRGTERGLTRWSEKVRAYAALFADPANVVAATGFRHVRVLIVARTVARRDWIWEAIEEIGAELGLGPEILERFWVTDKGSLKDEGLDSERWRVPGVDGLHRAI